MRFTVFEELSHILLGHTRDERFCVFAQQYPEEIYQQYEREARIAAGLLLCPPQFFYRTYPPLLERELPAACLITSQCAKTRLKVLYRYRDEIEAHPLYQELPTLLWEREVSLPATDIPGVSRREEDEEGIVFTPPALLRRTFRG